MSLHPITLGAATLPMLRSMVEAIFVGMSLFESAVWFLGGLLLGGIGLAFFVDSILFRRRAVQKRARILGVIRNKQGKGGQSVYWPVYEYMNARRSGPDPGIDFGEPRREPARHISENAR